jgi:HD superfamily phosphodiesterase
MDRKDWNGNETLKQLLDILNIYFTGDRDNSHSVEHLRRVVETSLEIAKTFENIDIKLLILCAYLHDFADHKYDNGTLKLKLVTILGLFLRPKEVDLCYNVIERVSFSREKNKGTEDWDILEEQGKLLRTIVSDADKLDAIHPKFGLERCIEYTMATTKLKRHDPKVKDGVKKHADEKLLILDKYIYTVRGKKIASAYLVAFKAQLDAYLGTTTIDDDKSI